MDDALKKLQQEHAKAIAELGELLVRKLLIDEAIAEKRRAIEAMDRAAHVVTQTEGRRG